MNRRNTFFDNQGNLLNTVYIDVDWTTFRKHRNKELSRCDWRFMSDQTPSQEWIDYRQFLRDLPENYPGDLANDACDALEAYTKPE
jgi:hypothetical protein